MTPEEMRVLYDYNAWANHRSLDAASSLTAEKFVQPMGSSFGSVRDTLGHIFGAEWIWLERFQGRSPASLPDTTQFKDAASLPRHGVQDAEVRRLPQSALGIDAASRQSRDVPSRAGHNPSAAAWRAAGPDRPDALLSRTIHRGGRVVYGTVPTLS